MTTTSLSTKRGFFGRMLSMIRTFFRRWWIINRLYHFMKTAELQEAQMIHVNQLAVKQSDFLDYLYRGKAEPRDSFDKHMRNAINECIDDRADYIDSSEGGGNNPYIALTTKGKEEYSVSHLIFRVLLGNSYVKATIIAIMTIFVTSYITNNVINKVSTAATSSTVFGQENRVGPGSTVMGSGNVVDHPFSSSPAPSK